MDDDKFDKLMKEMSEIQKSHCEAEGKLATSLKEFRKEVNTVQEKTAKELTQKILEVWLHLPEAQPRIYGHHTDFYLMYSVQWEFITISVVAHFVICGHVIKAIYFFLFQPFCT